MLIPKTRLICEDPVLKITGVRSGAVTPNNKAKAMPRPLAGKKKNKNDKRPYWTVVIVGVVTHKDKTAEACPCSHNFEKEFD